MTARKFHYLVNLGLGNFIGENPANAHAAPVDVEHDLGRLLMVFLKETFEHNDNEFHRRVIVVQ